MWDKQVPLGIVEQNNKTLQPLQSTVYLGVSDFSLCDT